ncbi:hypothetical protein H671_8g19236 [Cricetulus griseus]|nr:hypothetical protein H671_8g19236 [Cricetulus griseus]
MKKSLEDQKFSISFIYIIGLLVHIVQQRWVSTDANFSNAFVIEGNFEQGLGTSYDLGTLWQWLDIETQGFYKHEAMIPEGYEENYGAPSSLPSCPQFAQEILTLSTSSVDHLRDI